jgi:hypothetical protein
VSVAFDLDLDLVPGCLISRVFCEKWGTHGQLGTENLTSRLK